MKERDDDGEEEEELFTPPERPTSGPSRAEGGPIRKLSRYLDAFISNQPYCEDSSSRWEPPPAAPVAGSGSDRGAVVAVSASPVKDDSGVSVQPRGRRRGPVRLGDSECVVLTVSATDGKRSLTPPPPPPPPDDRSQDTLERLARAAEGCGLPELNDEDSEMSLLSYCR